MKKLIVLIMFLSCFTKLSSAQLVVKQGFGLEAYSVNHLRLKDAFSGDRLQVELGDFSFKYKMKLEYKSFAVHSFVDIYMDHSGTLSFDPLNATFDIDLTYTFRKFSFKIAHQCRHPISGDRVGHKVELQGGYTRIGIYYNW